MPALLVAVLLVLQTPPAPVAQAPSADANQAAAQAALQGTVDILKVMGSCERHFSPEQIRGIRRAFDPDRGRARTPLEEYLAEAYESGKTNRSWTAPMCREAMQALADARLGER